MSYGDAGAVAQLIVEEANHLPILLAMDIVRDICEGLRELHDSGITHGDIRPANVVLCKKKDYRRGGTERLVAQLSDFGFARRMQVSKKHPQVDGPVPMGTWPYVAPERLGGAPADVGSDIYAVGISLYEMLIGNPPFPPLKESIREVIEELSNGEPAFPLKGRTREAIEELLTGELFSRLKEKSREAIKELLRDEPPFPPGEKTQEAFKELSQKSLDGIIQGHLKTVPEPPGRIRPGVCLAIDEFVMRTLRKKSGLRFQSIQEVLDALESAQLAQTNWEKKLQELYQNAEQLRQQCKWKEAIQAFQDLIQKNAPYDDVPLKLQVAQAMQLCAQEKWAEAVPQLQAVLRADPGYQGGEVEKALKEAERQVRLALWYDEAIALFEEAMSSEKVGNWDDADWAKAVRCFSRIRADEPNYRDAEEKEAIADKRRKLQELYREAQQHIDDGDWNKAVANMENIVETETGYRDAASKLEWAKRRKELQPLYIQGKDLFDQGEWADAIKALKQVVGIDPKYKDAARLLHQARKAQSSGISSQGAVQTAPSPSPVPGPIAGHRPVPKEDTNQVEIQAGSALIQLRKLIVVTILVNMVLVPVTAAVVDKVITSLKLGQLVLLAFGLIMATVALYILFQLAAEIVRKSKSS